MLAHSTSRRGSVIALRLLRNFILLALFLLLLPSSICASPSSDDTLQAEVPAYPADASALHAGASVSSASSPSPSSSFISRYPPAAPLPADLSTLPRDSFPPVIWMAPFFSGGGYCSEAISFITALAPYLAPDLQTAQHGDSASSAFFSGLSASTRAILRNASYRSLAPLSAVTVCHSEPGAWYPPHYETARCPERDAAVRIGRTMFETDRLPAGWRERMQRMDVLWVPTAFHRDVFIRGGVDEAKIVVLPEPVDVEAFAGRQQAVGSAAAVEAMEYEKGERRRWERQGKQRPFRFLSIFKWEERKGWPILLTAYLTEFTASDAVELWILTAAYHSDADFDRQIQTFIRRNLTASVSQRPPVRLLKSGIPTHAMPSVYAAADAFVLPSRGEGWGRPHVEAMAMGLPLIATRWSGPSEYMTDNNSFPLEHDGFDTIQDGPFKGHQWARPSLQHLRALMRWVYTDREEAVRRGMQARRDMVERYCPACVARLLLQELTRFKDVRWRKRQKKTTKTAGKDRETTKK